MGVRIGRAKESKVSTEIFVRFARSMVLTTKKGSLFGRSFTGSGLPCGEVRSIVVAGFFV